MKSFLFSCSCLASLLFMIFPVEAQRIPLIKKQGIQISYQLKLNSTKKRNDVYVLNVWATNTTKKDYYYKVPCANSVDTLHPTTERKFTRFAKVIIGNSTEMFPKKVSLVGDETAFYTPDYAILFKISKGETIHKAVSFRMNIGVKPVIKASFTQPVQTFNLFLLKITPEIIAGNYNSDCNNAKIHLECINDTLKGAHLKEFYNGKYTSDWEMQNSNTYVRSDNPNYFLRYYHKGNSIYMLQPDGRLCQWKKE